MSGACWLRSVLHVFISNQKLFVSMSLLAAFLARNVCIPVPQSQSLLLLPRLVGCLRGSTRSRNEINFVSTHSVPSSIMHNFCLAVKKESGWCNEWCSLLCWGHVVGVGERVCWFVQVEECCISVYSGSALCLEQTLGLRLNISPRPRCALFRKERGATHSRK